MATTQEILVARQPSQRLHNAVIDIISHFGKLKDKVAYAIAIGQEEGWTPVQTGDLIRKELLAAGYHRNTAARVLPPEAKALPRGSTSTTNTVSNILVQNPSLLQPADYQTEDLDRYTKQFLIQVIRYLEHGHLVTKSKPKPSKAISNSQPHFRRQFQKVPEDKAADIIKLHKQGESSRSISRITGVSKTSVLRVLSR